MRRILVIGIGAGDPRHMTVEAIEALNAADALFLLDKGGAKADLMQVREAICDRFLTNPACRRVIAPSPPRDAGGDYRAGVDAWHAEKAALYGAMIRDELGPEETGAILVWGDPALYDSTLRIAGRVALSLPLAVEVVPGITSLQALTAAHAIPLNEIGAPVVVTTGRRLRDEGWPISAQSVAVMLDGECSFQALEPAGLSIWWGAYVGMAEELTLAGPLEEMAAQIIETRRAARARHGWIMDIYILRRSA